ncbi:hypothetical protein DYB36_000919 [Aphanomyces astaci]|uniref:Uncharacterized protein n=1 Tax=Aphanomyces astaci TaxID=112090 RepID=A0A397AKQ4_APHAT|nr:hypothetical protein DYB36_000919 [Aphanomyces astaci]
MRRYDPRDAAAAKTMEAVAPTTTHETTSQSRRHRDNNDDSDNESDDFETGTHPKWTDAPLPPVSTERYFTATSDLSTMFSRVRANSEDGDEMEPALDGLAISAAQTSSVFSFASMFETPVEKEAQDWSISSTAAADDDHTKGDDEDEAHRAWHFAKSTRDDGSTDGENEQEEEEQGPATTAVIKRPVAEVLAFGRTFFKPEQWTPEHEAAWVSMRKIYTVDFRRKHKQALKNRKSAKKAMSHHPKK